MDLTGWNQEKANWAQDAVERLCRSNTTGGDTRLVFSIYFGEKGSPYTQQQYSFRTRREDNSLQQFEWHALPYSAPCPIAIGRADAPYVVTPGSGGASTFTSSETPMRGIYICQKLVPSTHRRLGVETMGGRRFTLAIEPDPIEGEFVAFFREHLTEQEVYACALLKGNAPT